MPQSNGAPGIAASAPSGSAENGRFMKVAGAVKGPCFCGAMNPTVVM